MRTLIIISLAVLSLMACNNKTQIKENTEKDTTKSEQILDQNADSTQYFSEETLELNQEKTKSRKVERLITIEDDRNKLQELVIAKKFYKEEDLYILDYEYPYLNEEIDTNNTKFNDFFTENYLNIEATENEILEDKVIFCDSLGIGRCMDKRIIDYKIYDIKSNLISVLLYKENYYSGMKHSTYMFECLNFDLNNHKFIYYNDFFIDNSEKELLATINKTISSGINSGELYYECWELSEEDFKVYKHNFVVNDDIVEFYFDDCIICPSYTGTYSIEIPINKIMHLIKIYNNKPLIG
ncbi:RsiV family protein [Aquimarina rubra]|uniref:RsiV family protein n=1 Tax=Aquimarina rubra TaxID=1920033 RepID=A0ABW5LIN9_9FLAO